MNLLALKVSTASREISAEIFFKRKRRQRRSKVKYPQWKRLESIIGKGKLIEKLFATWPSTQVFNSFYSGKYNDASQFLSSTIMMLCRGFHFFQAGKKSVEQINKYYASTINLFHIKVGNSLIPRI